MVKPNIIVTGGAGYIGSHICKALFHSGFQPIVIDNLSRGHESFVKWGPLVNGNCGDQAFLSNVFTTYKPLAVIHCAAYTYVGESIEKPDLYYQNNTKETFSLLKEMIKHQIQHIIFSSTAAIYGESGPEAIQESHIQHPINPYGRSKLAIEWMIKDMAKAYNLSYSILRYFNAAGADPEMEIGEMHDPETHLIPLVLQTALGMREELLIFGNDFPTPDGTPIRDYVHVADLANAHVMALNHLLNGKSSHEINLGSGKGASVLDILKVAEQITEETIPTRLDGRRAGDPAVLLADIQKAKDILGWVPQHSDLHTILSTALNFQKKSGLHTV